MGKYREGKLIARDESNMKFVPVLLIPTLFIGLVGIFVFLIMGIINAIRGNYMVTVVCGCIMLCLIIFGYVCDHLEWHRNVKYYIKNSSFDYVYNLDGRILPVSNSEVVMHVKNIKSVKMDGKRICIRGDITKRAPMTKPKELQTVKLCDIPEKHDELMEAIYSLVVS